jgi:uncharacterized protein YbcI
MAGFSFRYRINGDSPTVRRLRFRDSGRLTKGDMLHFDGAEVGLIGSGTDDLVGIACETKAGTAATSHIEVIVDEDAVYGIGDANTRAKGAHLDFNGGTGAQGVGEGPQNLLEVVMDCAADEETLVRISVGKHGEPARAGGQLNLAIAGAIVRIQREYIGRGPTRARAFYRRDVIVVVMEDTLTKAERSLASGGETESVVQMRRRYQDTMRDQMVEAVEELTGSKVVAFMSDNHVDPDMTAELFVLNEPLPAQRPGKDDP